jgi:hypothetical protein
LALAKRSPQGAVPQGGGTDQLASDSSFHFHVHSINRGLEPLLVFVHAGRTQGDDGVRDKQQPFASLYDIDSVPPYQLTLKK